MVPVTRFNPSANGALHLGHLYMALINQGISQEIGGRFIVRFDDAHPLRLAQRGADCMARIVAGQREDLQWLGIRPCEWVKESDTLPEVHDIMYKRLPANMPALDMWIYETPELHGDDWLLAFPLAPLMTAQKVVFDWLEGVNLLVRGVDLMTEFSLYQWFCVLMDLPLPRHVYLPRLKWSCGDMSKSGGSISIAELRHAGETPERVREMVANACLHNPANGWTLENLKGRPRL